MEGIFKVRQIPPFDGVQQFSGGVPLLLLQQVQQQKVEGDVPVCKAAGAESLVQGIVGDLPAIYREKDPPAVLVLPPAHVLSQPGGDAAALIIVGAGALALEAGAGLEAVHQKAAHGLPGVLKVFDQLLIRHGRASLAVLCLKRSLPAA